MCRPASETGRFSGRDKNLHTQQIIKKTNFNLRMAVKLVHRHLCVQTDLLLSESLAVMEWGSDAGTENCCSSWSYRTRVHWSSRCTCEEDKKTWDEGVSAATEETAFQDFVRPVLRRLERRGDFVLTELPHGQRGESLVSAVDTDRSSWMCTHTLQTLNSEVAFTKTTSMTQF